MLSPGTLSSLFLLQFKGRIGTKGILLLVHFLKIWQNSEMTSYDFHCYGLADTHNIIFASVRDRNASVAVMLYRPL